jgi:hypothetical protein
MSYKKFLSKKEFDLMTEEYDKVKYRCSCGHRVIIPHWKDKALCSWCHHYVYKDKQIEFKEKMKEKLKNG